MVYIQFKKILLCILYNKKWWYDVINLKERRTKAMDYIKYANFWASHKNPDLRDFFKSEFFKSYVNKYVKSHNYDEDSLAYDVRLKISDDMQSLGLIPLTALEDSYSEEEELLELQKFMKLYKF